MGNPVSDFFERGYLGTVYWNTMMVKTGLQFSAVFRSPSAFVYMFQKNYAAWKQRILSGRKPWAHNLDLENTTKNSVLGLEYHGVRPKASKEKYLRPTFGVDPTAPEILALAEQLGAGKKTKRAYAEDAFNYVKNNVRLSMEWPRGGALGTLKAGTGTCVNKLTILATLLRANGIPARYRLAGVQLVQQMYDLQGMGENPAARAMYDSMGYVFGHGCIEALIDGEWLAGDPTYEEDLEAGMDTPITTLGMDPEGVWYFTVPGMTIRMEGLPFYLDIFGPMFPAFYRGVLDEANERFEQGRRLGRERLKSIGKERYVEMKKKFYVPVLPPGQKRKE